MKDLYTEEYLEILMQTFNSSFDELERWSIHNGDKGLDMIKQLRTDFEEVEKALYEK